MVSLLRSSLWGTQVDLKGQQLSHELFQELTKLATEQAVMGLVSQGLMDSSVRLERDDALNMFAIQQTIRQRNAVMDKAVVELCQRLEAEGIRMLVMKGQTIAALYLDAGLRQSGDIDFLIHPDDWEKAIEYVSKDLDVDVKDHNSQKHVEWKMDGVQYEMHRLLTKFAYPKHQRYWDRVVLPEIWERQYSVKINGYDVPTLQPTYNVLYTFVHIFYHLIIDGIGIRQFCDESILLKSLDFDKELLDRHLRGIGLRNAFTGLGAVMTDYLGLPEDAFPFAITDEDHRRAPRLMNNIIERGNFGHNVQYKHKPGILHGVEHLGIITKQAREFYHYAPAEACWRIPDMFKWWGIKILRILKGRV